MRNVIWNPQPRQREFMSRWEDERLYGGAAGGGKSDALLCEALRQVHIKSYRAIIFRQSYPQLEALISRSLELYRAAYPKRKYNDSKKVWTFPSGAKIFFGYMLREKDKYNYQGKPYDFIAFDELTQFTNTQYEYLRSRNRPTSSGTRVYMRATANPGGIGHGWVKERFITPAPPNTTIWTNETIDTPQGQKEIKSSRIFIPSTVFDNQKLLDNDPQYLARLAILPEAERNALLYGDWDSFSGQVFNEWVNDPKHYKDMLHTHVIEPFRIPKWWKIYRGLDWGYSRPFSVGWFAIDEMGRMYHIREYYGCTGTPNVGVKMNPREVARKIKEIESDDPNLKGRKIFGIADPAIFASDGNLSIADQMAKEQIYFNKGDHARIAGKMQFHYRLMFDIEDKPMFYTFNTCKNFIRTIPALVYDESDVEDINSDGEDHCLSADTLVWTDKGKIPIEQLVGTDGKVLSSDGEYHNYSDVRCTQHNVMVYEVTMDDGGVVKATANHKFKLRDGSWKRLDRLLEGDELWTMQ